MLRQKHSEKPLPATSEVEYVDVFKYYNATAQQNPQRMFTMSDIEREKKFYEFVRRYEINKTFAEKLKGLNGYEIVFVCDDSESMNTPLNDSNISNSTAKTRWDELKQTVSIVVDLASALDPDGVDIYFLNRQPLLNVCSSNQLSTMFALAPEGTTPMVPTLRNILFQKKTQIQTRKLLLLVATDGVPTDVAGREDPDELRRFLLQERQPTNLIPVTIIACTDDDDSMRYLNNWDKEIPNLDVVDDYKSEKKQIQECQRRSFPFSFGDYVVKIMMGGIDSWFDALDEKKVSFDCDEDESESEIQARKF